MVTDNSTINNSNLSTEQQAPTSEEIFANLIVGRRKITDFEQLLRCMRFIISEFEKANLQKETVISISPRSYAIFDSSIYRKALEKVDKDEEKTKQLCEKFSKDISVSMEQFVKSAIAELNKNYIEIVQFEIISCSGGECTGIEWDPELDKHNLIVSNFNFVITAIY